MSIDHSSYAFPRIPNSPMCEGSIWSMATPRISIPSSIPFLATHPTNIVAGQNYYLLCYSVGPCVWEQLAQIQWLIGSPVKKTRLFEVFYTVLP